MQMLLLEGDDMNQKTGICILLCLVLLLVFGIWYQKRGRKHKKYPRTICIRNRAHRFDRNSLQRNGKCLYYPYTGQPAGCFFTGWKNRIYGNRDSK